MKLITWLSDNMCVSFGGQNLARGQFELPCRPETDEANFR